MVVTQMRAMAMLAGLAVASMLAGCQPQVPNSAAGAGFGDYQSYILQREAQLRGAQAGSPTSAVTEAGPAATDPGAPLNATGIALPSGETGTIGTSAPTAAPTTAPTTAGPAAGPAGDGSIGSDTLAALRATAPAGPPVTAPLAPVSAPTPAAPLPVTGSAGPNLAAYALNSTNQPGQPVYSRGGLRLTSSERACAKYVSPDQAQITFLEAGGPGRDRFNLDPDGDGFACGWDPAPFRAARP